MSGNKGLELPRGASGGAEVAGVGLEQVGNTLISLGILGGVGWVSGAASLNRRGMFQIVVKKDVGNGGVFLCELWV